MIILELRPNGPVRLKSGDVVWTRKTPRHVVEDAEAARLVRQFPKAFVARRMPESAPEEDLAVADGPEASATLAVTPPKQRPQVPAAPAKAKAANPPAARGAQSARPAPGRESAPKAAIPAETDTSAAHPDDALFEE